MFTRDTQNTMETFFEHPRFCRNLLPSLAAVVGCSILSLGIVSMAHADNFILASQGNGRTIGGVGIDEDQLVDYDPATNMGIIIFDGSAFTGNERIDAVHMLPNGNILLSTASNAAIGSLSFNDEDIVEYDPGAGTASLFLDGSMVGGNFIDIDAFSILSNGNYAVSLSGTTNTPGPFSIGSNSLMGVGIEDLVEIDPATKFASLLFDGSELGFTNNSGILQNLDGVHALSNGNLVLSSGGNLTFAGISFEDEDLIVYTPGASATDLGTAAILYDDSEKNPGRGLTDITAVHVNEPNPIPEPGTVLLLGTGLVGLGVWRWKNSQKS